MAEKEKKEVAKEEIAIYRVTSPCIFEGRWHDYGEIIYLPADRVVTHSKLEKIDKVPDNSKASTMYDLGKEMTNNMRVNAIFNGIKR